MLQMNDISLSHVCFEYSKNILKTVHSFLMVYFWNNDVVMSHHDVA
jgi:hypothetical protein